VECGVDKQIIDLAREFVELGFYTLIMLGLCTTALCLTRVWATQEILKALAVAKPQARKMLMLEYRHAG
jgi:hypothetical protein